MERLVVYRRAGKMGDEFFIPLDNLPMNLSIIPSKETPKAYAGGAVLNGKIFVHQWIAKSLVKEIEGKLYCPTWIFKHSNITERICGDYYEKEFEVRDFPQD